MWGRLVLGMNNIQTLGCIRVALNLHTYINIFPRYHKFEINLKR